MGFLPMPSIEIAGVGGYDIRLVRRRVQAAIDVSMTCDTMHKDGGDRSSIVDAARSEPVIGTGWKPGELSNGCSYQWLRTGKFARVEC